MSKLFYTRIKFCGEDGFDQIELDNKGRPLIRQWLPNTSETTELFKKFDAVEVPMEELDTIYAEGNRLNYEDRCGRSQ